MFAYNGIEGMNVCSRMTKDFIIALKNTGRFLVPSRCVWWEQAVMSVRSLLYS